MGDGPFSAGVSKLPADAWGGGGRGGGRDPEVKATQTAGSRRGRRRLFLISVVKVPCSGRFCGCLDVKCQLVVRRAASVPG